ncbi:MAG: caspase family protein [Pseudorhodoplanes sp.]|nr:caspase family protein [Pseudorhodoplanes sp.]
MIAFGGCGLLSTLALVFVIGLWATAALAEKRVALVIGNSGYRHVPKLSNPANDADAVSVLLKSSGFAVVETRHDLGINDMRRAIRDFSDATRDADMAVVFYAGHGMEVGGNNYLVPVDAALERDIDVEDETVSLERILTVLEPAKRLRLVILDACRDNPFTRMMKRTLASRTIGRGLARVEPMSSDTLIAFAAKAGSTAADGQSVHSPFTTALLKHLATPGLDLRIAFGRVRDEVLKGTGNKQEPFVYGSLGGSNVALISAPADVSSGGVPAPPLDPVTARAWRDYGEAAKVATKEAWDSFLATHPTGFYADLARAQQAKIVTRLPSGPTEPLAIPKNNREPSNAKSCDQYQACVSVMARAVAQGKAHPDYCRTVVRSHPRFDWCKRGSP